ncbi:hypothetical protein B0H19DRAFT_1373700 [Mycena capillaripes]|nr:hypothetical protein B0H19DRAFT_1373700 [Mycena capillaripes]
MALASTVNITVDDEFGDPNGNKIDYQPPNAWVQGAIGGCSDCPLPSIPSTIAFKNTFHGSLLFNNTEANKQNQTPFTATFIFFGTYVSVNCIVSDSLAPPVGTSDMTFFIDGTQAGNFSHTPEGSSIFQAQTVFSSGPLSLQNHTLIIANGQVGGGSSLAILDSITYSIEDNLTSPTSTSIGNLSSQIPASSSASSSRNKQPSVAPIIGGVVGGVVFVVMGVGLTLWRLRSRKKRKRSQFDIISEYPTSIAVQQDVQAQEPPTVQQDVQAPEPPTMQQAVPPGGVTAATSREQDLEQRVRALEQQIALTSYVPPPEYATFTYYYNLVLPNAR